MARIVIAGGSGFLGDYLKNAFVSRGDEVRIIGRNTAIRWDDPEALKRALEGCDVLINLAGKSVNAAPTDKNKEEILQSRLRTTRLLGQAVMACERPPALWFNASAASLYADHSKPNVESNKVEPRTFMGEVARQWEEVFFSFHRKETRQIALRISLILGKDGGVYPVFRRLTQFGLAGRQGSGQQAWSWIHIADVYRLIVFCIEHPSVSGPINTSSPFPLTNAEAMKAFRKSFRMPIGIPAEAWMLRIGAKLIGTDPELLLAPMNVVPQKLILSGFQFQYPQLQQALAELSSDRSK